MIINSILTILAAAGLSLYYFDVLKLASKYKFKPFNCEPCMSFWFAFILHLILILSYSNVTTLAIVAHFFASTSAFIVYKILKQFYNE